MPELTRSISSRESSSGRETQTERGGSRGIWRSLSRRPSREIASRSSHKTFGKPTGT
nr:MAG TPA: hypothetical protein [Caudoviricetes sp.]